MANLREDILRHEADAETWARVRDDLARGLSEVEAMIAEVDEKIGNG